MSALSFGPEIRLFKLRINRANSQNIMCWICFRTRRARELHVGHQLGYIAYSDIVARYKGLKVLTYCTPWAMIALAYRPSNMPFKQGSTRLSPPKPTSIPTAVSPRWILWSFSFDWSREVRTSSPGHYKWTQWIFMQLFDSWYNNNADRG